MQHFRAVFLWGRALAAGGRGGGGGVGGGGEVGDEGRNGWEARELQNGADDDEDGQEDRNDVDGADETVAGVAERGQEASREGGRGEGGGGERDEDEGEERDCKDGAGGGGVSTEGTEEEVREVREAWCCPWEWDVCAWAAAGGSLSLATCPLVWQYAVQAEVFALNNFVVSQLLLLVVRFYRRGGVCVGTAYRGALWIGIGLTNQHTLVLYAAPLALCILLRGWQPLVVERPRRLAALAALGVVGLCPYVYLPLAGAKAAFGAWGEVDTLEGLAVHLLRREYGTWRLYSGNDGATERQVGRALWLYLIHLSADGTCIYAAAPALALLGLIRCACECVRERRVNTAGSALAVAYLVYMLVFHSLANLPLEQPLYYAGHTTLTPNF
jgi:hypothetical protein